METTQTEARQKLPRKKGILRFSYFAIKLWSWT